MKDNPAELLHQIFASVARNVARHHGPAGRAALVQQMVAEVQERTGATVSVSMAQAWLEDALENAPETDPEPSHDPWDSVDARMDDESEG